MSELEYFEYCFHCECEGEIPLTFEEINIPVNINDGL